MRLILYSKPGCHLCEGLQEKLEQVQSVQFDLEVRDITTCEEWFQAYQYEVPVLFLEKSQESGENTSLPNSKSIPILLPRPSPRASVSQLERLLQNYLD